MITSAVAGFILTLVAVCAGLFILIAAFQTLSGQRVRMPDLVKPLCKGASVLLGFMWETIGVVVNMVAEKLPPRYAYLKPLLTPLLKVFFICILLALIMHCMCAQLDR